MTKKQEYLNHLNKESTEWIRASEQVPQPTMSDLMQDYADDTCPTMSDLMDDYADDTCLNCGNYYNHSHNCSDS